MPSTMFKNHFVNGLRKDARASLNSELLEICSGLKPTEFGCVKPEVITNVTGEAVTWPLPQAFKGDVFTLVLTATGLYQLDSAEAMQEITVYEPTVSGSELLTDPNLNSSTEWVESGNCTQSLGKLIFANGGSVVTLDSFAGVGVLRRVSVAVAADTTVEGTNNRFRVTIGGVNSEYQIPNVGTMEFDVLSTGTSVLTISAEANCNFSIESVSVKVIAAVDFEVDLDLGSTTKQFQLMSMGEAWVLAGNDGLFMSLPSCGAAGASSELFWRTIYVPNATLSLKTACLFNDKPCFAGFDATDSRYDAAEFTNAFDIWRNKAKGYVNESLPLSSNMVFIGRVNGGDMNWPLAAELGLFGLPDTILSAAASATFTQCIRDGSMAFVRTPQQGAVMRIEPLGDALIIYSLDGVCAVKEGQGGEGEPMFKVFHIHPRGLVDYGAIVNAKEFGVHAFLDTEGKWKMLDSNLAITDLAHENVTGGLATDVATYPICSTYDTKEGDIYISNGVIGFGRTQSGMWSLWYLPTSIWQSAISGLVGLAVSVTPSSGKARLRTVAFDMAERALKVINDVELGAFDVTNVKVRLLYKNDYSVTYVSTDWISMIAGGFTLPRTSGYEFKLEFEMTPGTNARVDYAKLESQIRDKRNFRDQQGRV